jgi:2-hydroxychromene-2-carboxylate isomerase
LLRQENHSWTGKADINRSEIPITTRETVYFYYSVGSRYSYLASTQIEKLERETGCKVVWRPLYSVDLYELRGHNPFKGEPVSGQYDWDYRQYDAECWAEFYDVPYQEPRGVVEFDPRLLARACVAADQLGEVRSYSRSLFDAIFVERCPKIDEEECVRHAENIGIPKDRFDHTLKSPAVDRQLTETAREAHSKGAFGVPTFVIGDRIFWGNDRLVLVHHYLRKLDRSA